jgi:hypothetical protein
MVIVFCEKGCNDFLNLDKFTPKGVISIFRFIGFNTVLTWEAIAWLVEAILFALSRDF